MAEPRDAVEVDNAILADCQSAVDAALATAAAQAQQAQRWIEGGMPEGIVTAPGPADAPSQ